jgi:hypothetical protein
MKKMGLLIAVVLMVLMVASLGFAISMPAGHGSHGGNAGHGTHIGHGGHGGHIGHGGHGFWRGGVYIGAPAVYVGGYAYSAACATRCYDRVVSTCSTTIEGGQVCADQVVRTCRNYCY